MKKRKYDGSEGFIQSLKDMFEDRTTGWGWLMVFSGVPFVILGVLLQPWDVDWNIYLSYFGGFWMIFGFVWIAVTG